MHEVEGVHIRRCFTISESSFGRIVKCSLHHFSDACENKFRQVSYPHLVDEYGRTHCRLPIAKSHVAPIKYVTIPGMKFTSATLPVKSSVLLRKELHFHHNREMFWKDSEKVLDYISSQ